jgi:tetrahydromethanopterin S-methyltransferase subunit C
LFTVLYANTESHVNAKIPLKKTKRLIRLAVTYIILLSAVTYGLLTLLNYIAFVICNEVVSVLRFSVICAMPILTPYILYCAELINAPFENMVRRGYLRVASRVIKISAGKTKSGDCQINCSGYSGKNYTLEVE